MGKVKSEIVSTETEQKANPQSAVETNEQQSIAKPKKFSLDKFKSKRSQAIANVETLPNKLSVHHIKDEEDFVRVHHDTENYWSDELCFVSVPIKDAKKSENLHLIDEELALRYLSPKKIKRYRLALATNAIGKLFFCIVPTRNLDNSFNMTALKGIVSAMKSWTLVVRREGYDYYESTLAKNPLAFGEPKWPPQALENLIGITFEGRSIETEDDAGLLRLIGDLQDIS